MTEMTDEELIIRISTPAPGANLSNLIKAIAASMRWAAHSEKTDCDPDNIVYLSQLLEAITPEENQLR